jgi:glycosyltransferase involved in cell wall biosynthesis
MVHNEYAKPSGEDHAARAIASLLQDHGHEVSWYLKSSAALGATFSGKARAFFSGIYNPRSRAEIGRRLDSSRFDLVQVQNIYPQLSPSIFKPCRDRGLPIVMRCPNYRLFCPNGLHLSHGRICERCVGGREWYCVIQNCENDRWKSFGYAARNAFARISGMILDNISLFIVLSEFQKKKFMQNGIEPERIAVVPNFESLPEATGSANADPGETISFVGRLSPEKGIQHFIEAARALPQYPFAVAGDTAQISELTRAAPPNVHFHGFLTGRELDAFYYRTRILVYAGIWFEGFPNVITKAMAAGKPVVSSRIGSLPEIVTENETGLLFEPGNIDELVSRLEALYPDTDRCLALGARGRAKVEREYTPESVYPRLMKAYDRAAKINSSANV